MCVEKTVFRVTVLPQRGTFFRIRRSIRGLAAHMVGGPGDRRKDADGYRRTVLDASSSW